MTRPAAPLLGKSVSNASTRCRKQSRHELAVGVLAPGTHYCSSEAFAYSQSPHLKHPLLHFSSLEKVFFLFFVLPVTYFPHQVRILIKHSQPFEKAQRAAYFSQMRWETFTEGLACVRPNSPASYRFFSQLECNLFSFFFILGWGGVVEMGKAKNGCIETAF